MVVQACNPCMGEPLLGQNTLSESKVGRKGDFSVYNSTSQSSLREVRAGTRTEELTEAAQCLTPRGLLGLCFIVPRTTSPGCREPHTRAENDLHSEIQDQCRNTQHSKRDPKDPILT